MLKLVNLAAEEEVLDYKEVKQVIRQKRANKETDIIKYCKDTILKVNKLMGENGYSDEVCCVGYTCYYTIALEYKRQNEFQKAINFCREAEKWIDPIVFYANDSYLLYWLYGECYFQLKEHSQSKRYFNRCIKYYRAIYENGLRAIVMFNKARMSKNQEKHIEKILISLKNIKSSFGDYFIEDDYMLQIAEYLKQLYKDKNDIFNSFRIDKTYIKPLKGGE